MPTKEETEDFILWQKYIGKCLGYRKPGDLFTAKPMSDRLAIHYCMKSDNMDEIFFYSEIVHENILDDEYERRFTKIAQILSNYNNVFIVKKIVIRSPLKTTSWFRLMDWSFDFKTNFMNLGKKHQISENTLTSLFNLIDGFLTSAQKNKIILHHIDKKKIINSYHNIFNFENHDDSSLVISIKESVF